MLHEYNELSIIISETILEIYLSTLWLFLENKIKYVRNYI